MKIHNAQQAAALVARESIYASMQKTFAVGGLIVNNRNGEVVHSLHNNVLKPCDGRTFFLPHDPTAHGERQLVDWYYAHKAEMNLPLPHDLTVVTSLDPCAMCAGALLLSDFNVAVSAPDSFAGINFNQQFSFPSLSPKWRQLAQQRFGYYGVSEPINKDYQGGQGVIFSGQKLEAETYLLTDTIFESSVNDIREISDNNGRKPADLTDPATLPVNSPVRQAFAAENAHAFSLKFADSRMATVELLPLLANVAEQAHNQGATLNAVAFVDPFGNVLLVSGGREDKSPIRTAFIELTRSYAKVRWELMNNPDATIRAQASSTLTHPKYGTFVFLFAPDPVEPASLLDFGAYGSTMEGPIPQVFPSNLQYVSLRPGVSQEDLARMVRRLPPFYTTDVQLSPMQVLSRSLYEGAAILKERF